MEQIKDIQDESKSSKKWHERKIRKEGKRDKRKRGYKKFLKKRRSIMKRDERRKKWERCKFGVRKQWVWENSKFKKKCKKCDKRGQWRMRIKCVRFVSCKGW